MQRLLANPLQLRRLAVGALTAAAFLGATGTLLRETADGRSWTYLLDTAGWMLAVASAIAEARVSTILAPFQPHSTRRRSILHLFLGIVAALGGCLLLSLRDGDGPATVVRIAAAAALIGGIGSGLGGGLSLAVTAGARYAADRLATLDQD